MAFDFGGKKVLVTGAGKGIGRGVALALAKAGCKVYALDIDPDCLSELAKEDSNINTIVQDLTNWDETRATFEGIEPLDGLVNNAGAVFSTEAAVDTSKAALDAHMSLNLYAVINGCQVIGKKMTEAGKKGSIVNISSVLAHNSITNMLAYDVSKAGVDMVTKQFSLELGQHEIRVNSVNPTMVDTTIFEPEQKDHVEELCTGRMVIPRMIRISEVVGPVLYLLSDYSTMVTGTTHMVDGGTTANLTIKS